MVLQPGPTRTCKTSPRSTRARTPSLTTPNSPATTTTPTAADNATTNKCKVCHAVHRAEGAYYLLRADGQDDACTYCHIGSAHSSKIVYDLNSAGMYTTNGHTIGASSTIPDSSVAQWTEQATLSTLDANGNTITETINVRAYSEQRNEMYRFARHHGQSALTGGPRSNYIPIGPLALRCMSCHQVHNAQAQTWRSVSMAAMSNTGRYLSGEVSSYKLLKQFPSGTFVGGLDDYGQVPLSNISIVPETTLTAGVNHDSLRAEGDEPTPMTLLRDGAGLEYNKPMWVAQELSREGYAAAGPRSNPAAVNNAALSVWCADCHNLNIGGSKPFTNVELGFKAHTERTHPSPFVGAFNGPGQCYSCHRNDLPAKNAGDPCSQCHYGTGNYRENRYDPASYEYVDSDFPHSGEDGGFKMLGSYSVDVLNLAPTTIDEEVLITAENLDAVCLRCHWVEGQYHEGATGTDGHSIPAQYSECVACHQGADFADIHVEPGCGVCHDSAALTTDCAACHPDKLDSHGYEVVTHTAAPGNGSVMLLAARTHEVATWDCEVTVDCAMCHSTDLGKVHDNNCWSCHPSPVNTLTDWNGSCSQGGCHPTYHEDTLAAHWNTDANNSECTLCHDSSWTVSSTSCMNCHAGYSASDTAPPATTSNALASHVGPARISFSVTDGGKIAAATTYYRVDGGALMSGSTAFVTAAGKSHAPILVGRPEREH